jgi:hypothetical protein
MSETETAPLASEVVNLVTQVRDDITNSKHLLVSYLRSMYKAVGLTDMPFLRHMRFPHRIHLRTLGQRRGR